MQRPFKQGLPEDGRFMKNVMKACAILSQSCGYAQGYFPRIRVNILHSIFYHAGGGMDK